LVGVPVIFYSKPSVPPRGGSTLGYDYAALRAQISAHRWRGKFQFIAQRGGFFQNVADISILYKIFGTRVKMV
jgi:hypothetical protein